MPDSTIRTIKRRAGLESGISFSPVSVIAPDDGIAPDNAESLLIGCFSTLVQCLPRARRKFNFAQTAFNFSNMALSIGAARFFYHSHIAAEAVPSHSLLLAIAAAAYFAVNSFPVAVIISLTESKSVLRARKEMFQLSFPYFA